MAAEHLANPPVAHFPVAVKDLANFLMMLIRNLADLLVAEHLVADLAAHLLAAQAVGLMAHLPVVVLVVRLPVVAKHLLPMVDLLLPVEDSPMLADGGLLSHWNSLQDLADLPVVAGHLVNLPVVELVEHLPVMLVRNLANFPVAAGRVVEEVRAAVPVRHLGNFGSTICTLGQSLKSQLPRPGAKDKRTHLDRKSVV